LHVYILIFEFNFNLFDLISFEINITFFFDPGIFSNAFKANIFGGRMKAEVERDLGFMRLTADGRKLTVSSLSEFSIRKNDIFDTERSSSSYDCYDAKKYLTRGRWTTVDCLSACSHNPTHKKQRRKKQREQNQNYASGCYVF